MIGPALIRDCIAIAFPNSDIARTEILAGGLINTNIKIEFSSEETTIKGDEALLRRLLLNLFDNAVKYNIDGGKIGIKLADNTVTVSNTGEEIGRDHEELIFDRFYRIEKNRSHKHETLTSGAGLGHPYVFLMFVSPVERRACPHHHQHGREQNSESPDRLGS